MLIIKLTYVYIYYTSLSFVLIEIHHILYISYFKNNKIMSKKKEKRYRCRELIAESLVAQGVEFCFGIVGYPVQEL